jgi:hypothetical protein
MATIIREVCESGQLDTRRRHDPVHEGAPVQALKMSNSAEAAKDVPPEV